jgi:hypothetical protein
MVADGEQNGAKYYKTGTTPFRRLFRAQKQNQKRDIFNSPGTCRLNVELEMGIQL